MQQHKENKANTRNKSACGGNANRQSLHTDKMHTDEASGKPENIHGNKRRVGTAYEGLAADYLRQRGYRILEHSYRIRQGEIDLIAAGGRTIVFVEVKYRKNGGCGAPSEAVSYAKQKTISRVAAHYLICHGLWERCCCRFDVIEIEGTQIRHIENAFSYIE